MYTTDIRQVVKEGVDVSGNDDLVEIHHDRDVHLHNEVFFIRQQRLRVQLKDGRVFQLSELVQADGFDILQEQLSCADDKGGRLLDLRVHGDPHNPTFSNDRIFTKKAIIETNLIVDDKEELVLQELGYLCI